MFDKSTVRNTLRAQRNALMPEVVQQRSLAVLNQIKTLPIFSQARRIALYFSDEQEIDTRLCIDWCLAQRKTLYFPVMQKNTLGFYQYDERYVCANHLGILQPDVQHCEPLAVSDLDIVVMPLVAFDVSGGRIGRGGGYYDRALAPVAQRAQPVRVALAYDWQCIEDCHVAEHDVKMHYIVTPAQVVSCV